MANTTKRVTIIGNPGARAFGSPKKKKYKSVRPATGHRTSSNPGQIIGYTLLGNPGGKRRKAMATAKKAKKKSKHHGGGYGKSKYKNPGSHSGSHVTKRHHHNPGGLTGRVGNLGVTAAFAIAGSFISKAGAQMILGANNVGMAGYAGNAAVGAGLWFVVEKFLKSPRGADGVAIGTLIQIILRAINDYTPFGTYVANLGMGDYQMQSFVTPQILVDPLNSADVQIPGGWAPVMLPPPPAVPAAGKAGVGSLYGGGSFGGGLYSLA